jgi:hypothetical protein
MHAISPGWKGLAVLATGRKLMVILSIVLDMVLLAKGAALVWSTVISFR